MSVKRVCLGRSGTQRGGSRSPTGGSSSDCPTARPCRYSLEKWYGAVAHGLCMAARVHSRCRYPYWAAPRSDRRGGGASTARSTDSEHLSTGEGPLGWDVVVGSVVTDAEIGHLPPGVHIGGLERGSREGQDFSRAELAKKLLPGGEGSYRNGVAPVTRSGRCRCASC